MHTPPPSTTPPLPRNHHPRHTRTSPPGRCSTHICTNLSTVICGRSISLPRLHAQSPLPPGRGLPPHSPSILRLSDADFICGVQCHLEATSTNPSIPVTSCYCGQHVQGSEIDHAMTCRKLSVSRSRRHNDWKDALSCVSARAGCSNRVEPGCNDVGTTAPGRAGSRADIEAKVPPPHDSTLLDVSLTHPRAAT